MMSLLGQTLDQTARSSLIKDLKRQLILRAAKDLTCDKVFTGECATSLAITLLSGKAMYIRLADIKSGSKKIRHIQKLTIEKKSTFFCPILMILCKND